MGIPPFLTEFLMILIVATLIAVTFERIRLPSILGFLLAGVIIGPHGFGLLSDVTRIHQLAELGVVLLMLTIGLEFSFNRLKGLGRVAILGGSLQILLSILVSVAVIRWQGRTFYEGFFLGAVIALSSTAIVLKYLMDRGELDTDYGRIAFSILIFQDIAVVPLMIFINGLGQPKELMLQAFGLAFAKTSLLFAAVILFSRLILPPLLHRIAMTRNREIFFLASVVVCLGTSWLSAQLGLSLAIGAFFAGVMFANTDFRHQLTGEFTPFRYLFVSIFFVSIGLLFDIHFTLNHFGTVASTVGLVLLINFVLMTILLLVFGFPPRVAMVAGVILSQIGEFSFLLLEIGRSSGRIGSFQYQNLLSTAFITMLMTPLLFLLIPLIRRLAERSLFLGMPPVYWGKSEELLPEAEKNHVILCGFGPSGHDLALTFREEKIPFVLIEVNPTRVREAKTRGITVIYGDASNVEVLKRAGIDQAVAVMVSFPDPMNMAQIIRIVQRLNPNVVLAVRTRYEAQMPKLYELGADIVVMEEWEASYELNRLILEHFDIPQERVERHLERIRTRKEFAIEEAILRRASRVSPRRKK